MKLSNTSTRVLVALAAIPLFIIACLVGRYLFLALVLFITLIAYSEFAQMARKKGHNPYYVFGFIAIAAIVLNDYINFAEFHLLVICIVLPIVSLEMFRKKGSPISNIGSTLLGIFYIGTLGGCLVKIREFYKDTDYLNGGLIVLTVMAAIWVCDSAAYFGGLRFGKHRLFQRVSPKKSWEGAIFGFIFSIVAAAAGKHFFLSFLSWEDSIVIGVLVGIAGQIGDLSESWLKRDAGVKDSSNLIPGHGGVFDRFDSLIAAAPAVYVYLKLFVK